MFKWILIIISVIFLLFIRPSDLKKVENFYRNPSPKLPLLDKNVDKNAKIPKIIHQTAPADKSKWHSIWERCQESWKKNFPDYEYKMWTDEDNENLIKTKYNWFYPTYKAFKNNISRVDCSRYFFLYEHGGIYADMDFECLKNFEHLLPTGKACIAESPHGTDIYENALMATPPKHPFWLCLILNIYENRNSDNAFAVTVHPVDKTVQENKDIFFKLESRLFAPKQSEEFKSLGMSSKEQIEKNMNTKHSEAYTRHHGTGVWFQK